MTTTESRPTSDEIEVSVFSRGYGESIAIHLGEGKWLIIDSLKDEQGQPAAIAYLDAIGVNVAQDVVAVLITHWHDDHIGGAAEVVRRCSSAIVAIPGVFMKDELKQILDGADVNGTERFSSGIDELQAVFEQVLGRRYVFCWSNRILFERNGNLNVRVECLSPSDQDYLFLLQEMPNFLRMDDVEKRVPSPPRNDASVAVVLHVGDDLLLFGADLEVTGQGSGWEAVHSVAWNQRGKACFFKIPHHGSRTGHHLPIWQDLLQEDVVAALTPWNRGHKLPTIADIQRINTLTSRAHSAAKVRQTKSARRPSTVETILREKKIRLTAPKEEIGHLRFRKSKLADWRVEYGGDSSALNQSILS